MDEIRLAQQTPRSNAGLYRFNKENVKRKIKDSAFDLHFDYFGLEDGIKNIEFNGGCSPCANILSNGNISFPTIQGLVFVDPKTISSTAPLRKVFTIAL